MESAVETSDISGEVIDSMKKTSDINALLKMGAINSVITNLNNEDAEMLDWYGRENALLDGKPSSNGLSPKEKGEGQMLVAGDNTTKYITNHNYPQPQSEPLPTFAEPKPDVQPQEKERNSILQNTAIMTLGAVLLGGGMGLGKMLEDDPVKHPEVKQIEDTDTIGILEPDRE